MVTDRWNKLNRGIKEGRWHKNTHVHFDELKYNMLLNVGVSTALVSPCKWHNKAKEKEVFLLHSV